MMHRPRAVFFGNVQKMIAQALHDAGKLDAEIALEIGTSVNNIRHWRREAGLPEHLPPPRPADDVPWNASGDIPGTSKRVNRLEENQAGTAPEPQISTAERNESVRASTTPLPVRTSPVRTGNPSAPMPLPAPGASSSGDTPPGENALEIGTGIGGRKMHLDLEELLTTRLLIQGNSGSGKSHLLRRILEMATGIVQQIVIDPEGDFVSFEAFGHTIIDAGKVGIARLGSIAGKVRQHRGSAVLNLEALDLDQQMEAVAAFLTGLFDAPQDHWHPVLVAVDEAQMFAPVADNGEDREARKASLIAMTNLMCRGRKRGLVGIIATQRIAKLHKNVAAEASNFLVGRTFLDIDIARAADLIGMAPRDAKQIRDLNRGEFLGLGPAISRQPSKVKVGDCTTAGKTLAKGLAPLPDLSADEMQGRILADDDDEAPAPALRIVK